MYKKSYLLFILFGLFVVVLASCDRDFNAIGANIVGSDHFGLTKYNVTIKSYNQKVGPVGSNNLPTNPLGFFENPVFGNIHSNFVTQVALSVTAPVFNNIYKDSLYEKLPVIDSVVVEIPYFYDNTQTVLNSDGSRTYVLDSIYGVNESKFKLSLYQSNYYLRNFDPNLSLGTVQSFYTNQGTDIDNYKIPVLLNDSPDVTENAQFFFDKREHILKSKDSNGADVLTRTAPSMRLHLNKAVFNDLILNAPTGQLVDNNTFNNYFRGLYFKTESLGNPGNMAMINFLAGKITMYYQEDSKSGTGASATYPRVSKTYVLNLTGNTISLQENSNENSAYLDAINNPSQEASRLFLRGGEGATTVIDIFNPADSYGYIKMTDANGNPMDENGNKLPLDPNGNPVNGYYVYKRIYTANGVSDELDDLRYPKLKGSEYFSKEKKLLINDANLVFYIDRTAMGNTINPQRVFLYDMTNYRAIVDYALDGTSGDGPAKGNKVIYGGIIQKDTDGNYEKYTIRLTNHIRNLLNVVNDSDVVNVRLGLSVTENINNVGFSTLKTANSNFTEIPSMSVMSPLGTILVGSASTDDAKRLKLEISYTKPY